MRCITWAVLCIAFWSAVGVGQERPRCDLTGEWDFYPDVADADLAKITVAPSKIYVPGAWQTQGFGPAGGTIPSSVIGSDLSPAEYLRHNLTARCLYVRDVEVPTTWRGQRVFLCVRRVYRYADVTINNTRVGQHEGFCSPFEFDITDAVEFGKSARIVLGVDNRQREGRDTVGTANYLGNWGGIGGAVYLEARSPVFVQDVFAMPDVGNSQVVLRVTWAGTDRADAADQATALEIESEVGLDTTSRSNANAAPAAVVTRVAVPRQATGSAEFETDLVVPLASPRLWTPDTPFLYVARVRLRQGGQVRDEMTIRFGMREITARGDKLFLNGHPLYLSGYGDDATEPITGMLPADKELYRQRLATMRSLGFNFVRHHSCVPHDEYLEAADEVGMLVQPEAGMAYIKYWPKAHGLFSAEWPKIIRAFRNHPSIWAWCMGNELFLHDLPESGSFRRQDALEIVAQAYHQAKELDPTRLVHASDGGTPQAHTDVVSAGGWEPFGVKPYLFHEYGLYATTLPDFTLVPRLQGVIRPLTYERAAKFVQELDLNGVYLRLWHSSLQMRADAQKYHMEAAKAVDGNCGYSFWLGVDFPDSPEGCWDEGILNQLWEPKPFLTENLVDYTGATVLLNDRGLESRSFIADEGMKVGLSVWHYGAEPIADAELTWRLMNQTDVLASGVISGVHCAAGSRVTVGDVQLAPIMAERPLFLTLEVALVQRGQQLAKNAWQCFAYPRTTKTAPIPGVYSEIGEVAGARVLSPDAPLPDDVRVLITDQLRQTRHATLAGRDRCAVLLLGTGGFEKVGSGYFLNGHGAGYGGIVEPHPVFADLPLDGRVHLGLYQLFAGGHLLATEQMPPSMRDGGVIWGLRLTAWISQAKDLHKVTQWSEVKADQGLHVVLCSLDLRSERPESRYVLARTIAYLLSGKPSEQARSCTVAELLNLLR